MKKALMIVSIIILLTFLIGCYSSHTKANFIIRYTHYEPSVGVEVLAWIPAEMVWYYGPNSDGVIVCLYSMEKEPTNGLTYRVVGNVMDVYFEGTINPNNYKVQGKKLEYFDYRDDILLYYP